MRTIRLQIAATETRCGAVNDCQFSEKNGSRCAAFHVVRKLRHSLCGYWYERLPECIAAEKEAGK